MSLLSSLRRSGGRVPVHFLHIRKTGGSALTSALGPIAEEFGIVLHDHSTRMRDIPRDHQVFFIVRHPVPRFVSGFISRLRRGMPRYKYEWTAAEIKAFSHFATPNDLAEALFADIDELRMQAREAMRGIAHVNSSYKDWIAGEKELEKRLDSIVLIGLQETLNADFERLKKILNLPHDLYLPVDDVLAHRTPKEFDRSLSPLAERNLLNWYAEDIRFYNYCQELRAARCVAC